MSKQVYIAGHCLDRGSQLQRAEERDMVKELGYEVYCPQDNEEINDKQNAVQEGLAERIVKHDMDAIRNADIILIEPLAHALGTTTELGQIHGRKDLAKELRAILNADLYPEDALCSIHHLVRKVEAQKVYAHCSDIRRTDIPEQGDRRSFATNQYVYGTVLELTDGKGFYSMEEIQEELSA